MFGNDGIAGSYNSDVLDANPTSVDDKLKLVEELKTRAKGCISSRNFPVAIRLYTKAIEIIPADSKAAAAVLYANRSMCHLNMSNAASALDDAIKSESTDSSYVKCYYRKAMALKALGDYSLAKQALESGLAAKSDDKEMKNQLALVEKAIVEGKDKNDKKKPVVAAARSTTTISNSKPAPTTQPAQNTTPKSTSTAPTAQNSREDDDLDVQDLTLRGYKKTSDGRTTTFFNNELDETAKKLIGDIAPKKLDVAAASSSSTQPAAGQGSAWNSAGTYEERILTPWAKSFLTAEMAAISLTVPAHQLRCGPALAASVNASVENTSICLTGTGTENVEGDAQVTMNRGKKKYVADFSLTLLWKATLQREGGEDTVSGKMAVLDITADDEYELGAVEVTHYNTSAATTNSLPPQGSLILRELVKSTSTTNPCFQMLIHKLINKFCVEFKKK